jgi:hypothetical protein
VASSPLQRQPPLTIWLLRVGVVVDMTLLAAAGLVDF